MLLYVHFETNHTLETYNKATIEPPKSERLTSIAEVLATASMLILVHAYFEHADDKGVVHVNGIRIVAGTTTQSCYKFADDSCLK